MRSFLFLTVIFFNLVFFNLDSKGVGVFDHCAYDDAVCVGNVLLNKIQPAEKEAIDVVGVSCQDQDGDSRWVLYQIVKTGTSLKEVAVYANGKNDKFTQHMCEDVSRRVPRTCNQDDKRVQFFACQDADLDGVWALYSIVATTEGKPWVATPITTNKLTEIACKNRLFDLPHCVF